jgi:hypothetical protein
LDPELLRFSWNCRKIESTLAQIIADDDSRLRRRRHAAGKSADSEPEQMISRVIRLRQRQDDNESDESTDHEARIAMVKRHRQAMGWVTESDDDNEETDEDFYMMN